METVGGEEFEGCKRQMLQNRIAEPAFGQNLDDCSIVGIDSQSRAGSILDCLGEALSRPLRRLDMKLFKQMSVVVESFGFHARG